MDFFNAQNEPIHPSIPTTSQEERNQALLKKFRRLLVFFQPSRQQFHLLFQELRHYFRVGHDLYWQAHSESIADDIPCSQEAYFENRDYYDRYRHPKFRLPSSSSSNNDDDDDDNNAIGGYTTQELTSFVTND